MIKSYLLQLGLNNSEIKVYLILLQKKISTAGEVIKKTGLHRNIVYDNLERLIDRGLISYIIEGKVKHFQVEPVNAIEDMIDKEQEQVENKRKIAKDLEKELKKIDKKQLVQQEATVFRGINGMKALLKDTLTKKGQNYFVFGAPKASVEIMGEIFWKNYNVKRKEKNIVAKMVFNEELRQWSKIIINNITKIKFLSEKFDSLTETMIYGDKVAIIVWTDRPIATLIKDKNLAKSYKKYFEILWTKAKR